MLKVSIFLVALVGATCAVNLPKAPIIPEQPDPLFIEDFVLDVGSLNQTEELATGIFSLCNGTVTGLSGLLDQFTITAAPGIGAPLRQRVIVNISLPSAEILGRYSADIELLEALLPESGHVSLTGQGALAGRLENAYVNIAAYVLPLGKSVDIDAAIKNLDIDIGFDVVVVNVENLAVNGTLIEWEEFNRDVKEIFDLVWGQIKGPISDLINDAINTMIEDCTIADIIGIIGGGPMDCIKIPTPPEFGIRDDIDIPCQHLFQCPGESGNFPDPADCARFYACDNFAVVGHPTCPDDLLFNPNLGNCDFPWNVDCQV